MNQEEMIQNLLEAVAFHNQGQLDQAEEIYNSVLAIDKNNYDALNLLGCIHRERKKFDKGIILLCKAIKSEPTNPGAYYNLGNIYRDSKLWHEAIKQYKKTISFSPENVEALNSLGICLNEVESYEHSEIVLRKAVQIQPEFAST